MSLVLRYKFNEPTASLTTDSSGNSYNLTNEGGVVSFDDATLGNVAQFEPTGSTPNAYFTRTTVPSELSGMSPWTFSFWINKNGTGGYLFWYGDNALWASGGRITATVNNSNVRIGTNVGHDASVTLPNNTWHHIAFTYDGSTNGRTYTNGVLAESYTMSQLNISATGLEIGAGNNGDPNFIFNGYMSDFRAYDDALSAAEVASLYSEGANPPPMSVTMYTHIADFNWSSVTGATTYTLTSKKDAGSETTLIETSDLTYSLFNLSPGSSYQFSLYTDLDTVTPVDISTNSALSVDSTTVDSLVERMGNDLTLLNPVSISEISQFIPQVFSTGEVVNTILGESKFVENSGTITLSDPNDSILTAFDATAGSGQTASIVLPDQTTVLVEFEETTGQITIGSTSYSAGEHLVLGGLKATVKEF